MTRNKMNTCLAIFISLFICCLASSPSGFNFNPRSNIGKEFNQSPRKINNDNFDVMDTRTDEAMPPKDAKDLEREQLYEAYNLLHTLAQVILVSLHGCYIKDFVSL